MHHDVVKWIQTDFAAGYIVLTYPNVSFIKAEKTHLFSMGVQLSIL